MQNHGAQQAMFIAAITFGLQSDMGILVHMFPKTYPESLLKRTCFDNHKGSSIDPLHVMLLGKAVAPCPALQESVRDGG